MHASRLVPETAPIGLVRGVRIDRISRLKRNLYVKKRQKQVRQEPQADEGASTLL